MSTKQDPPTLINWNAVNKAHSLRDRIILTFASQNGEPLSPNGISKQLDEPLSKVSYHIGELVKLKALALKDTAQRRGAVEHFYVLTSNVLLSDVAKKYAAGVEQASAQEWEKAAKSFRNALEAVIATLQNGERSGESPKKSSAKKSKGKGGDKK